MRGCNKEPARTSSEKKHNMQIVYDAYEKLMRQPTHKNAMARLRFETPPYCIGERRKQWEASRNEYDVKE